MDTHTIPSGPGTEREQARRCAAGWVWRKGAASACAAVAMALALTVVPGAARGAVSAEELNAEVSQALQALYKSNPAADALGKRARATLVFPKILKAGLVFGGSYGEGVLMQGSRVDGYYNSVSASWGWQAGAQSYGYVVFLMNDRAVKYLHRTRGWEIGVGPTVLAVDAGVARNLSTSTLKDHA